jgi:hypothetical protein
MCLFFYAFLRSFFGFVPTYGSLDSKISRLNSRFLNSIAATSRLFKDTNFPQISFFQLLHFWKIPVVTAVWEPCILFKVPVPELIFRTAAGSSGLVKTNSRLRSFFSALFSWFLMVANGPPQPERPSSCLLWWKAWLCGYFSFLCWS